MLSGSNKKPSLPEPPLSEAVRQEMDQTLSVQSPRLSALLPLLLFLLIFVGSGLYYTLQGVEFAFYQVKAPVAALPAVLLALLAGQYSFNEKLRVFVQGIGDGGIITMCLVFLLAGAFSAVMQAIGGVESTINCGLSIIPSSFVLPGLFVIAAFISTSMGTSMGTIAAVAPIAVGFAGATSLTPALTVGAVVGGAMFGDNLSVISDTTIAATRTQGCAMRDKFKQNARVAIPAGLLTLLLLFTLGQGAEVPPVEPWQFARVLPYLVVLILALTGLNVLLVLSAGIVLAGMTGIAVAPAYTLASWADDIYQGFGNMQEIMILSMFIGGIAAVMQAQGGLEWISRLVSRFMNYCRLSGRKGGGLAIGLLVSLCNLFTANNTVAIIISGSVARDIARRNEVSPQTSASVLDIFSCVVQGVIPYGAQILLAGSIAGLSPLQLSGQIWYCWVLAAGGLLMILMDKSDCNSKDFEG
ncbi:Na+/H+ antiporter NhaC family protein [Endozoicomonadaceae bacterium StTr2]